MRPDKLKKLTQVFISKLTSDKMKFCNRVMNLYVVFSVVIVSSAEGRNKNENNEVRNIPESWHIKLLIL